MPLQFTLAEPHFDPITHTLRWYASDGLRVVLCRITRSAIDDLYLADDLTEFDRRVIFNRHRAIIQAAANKLYDDRVLTEQADIVVKTSDLAEYHGTFGIYHRPPPGKLV